MNGTYSCLERNLYAGLEAFTYGGMEACVIVPIEVNLIFTSCRPRRVTVASIARSTQFDPSPRDSQFTSTARQSHLATFPRSLLFVARPT